jgi:hypothetical protein
MRNFSQNHDWLSINTATIRKQSGAEVPLDRIIDQCAERGIRAISPWRDQVAAVLIDSQSWFWEKLRMGQCPPGRPKGTERPLGGQRYTK